MKHINSCAVCGYTQINKFNGTLFPFVTDRMQGITGSDTFCYSIHCPMCDYHGTSARFNSDEESRYYKDYMTGDYLESRIRYEGPSVLSVSQLKHDQGFIENRKSEIYSFISDCIPAVNSLLDYGGNNGEGIPNQFRNARQYVLETEVKNNADGIIFVTPTDTIEPLDLVICSHVFEHISDINYHMQKIKELLTPGGYLYLEVPNERNAQGMDGRIFHEHINIFSMNNLEYLFNMYDLDVIKKVEHTNSYGAVFSLLGKLK